MRTKEEYYEHVLENRRLASDPAVLRCTCPKVKCEWHGRCRECVALHRHHGDHLPNCFQLVFNDRLKAAAAIGELLAVEKEQTPDEYREYVKERDRASS